MKIALLAALASKHTQKWYRELTARGLDVHVITAHPADDCGIPAVRVDSGQGLKRLFTAGAVSDHVKYLKPDIVHAYYATSYGFWAARTSHHPLVISVWGSDIAVTPRKSLAARILTSYSLNRADAVCATSNYLKEETCQMFKGVSKKIEVIPFGVDTDLFKPGEPKENGQKRLVLGSARTLERTYGLDVLIRAFRDVLPEHPYARLRIAGDGSARRELQNLAKSLSLMDRTEFLGDLAEAEMPEFLRSLDIAVLPSRLESFGVAAVEALACGIPVIGSNIGGIPEILGNGECGSLVEPDSVDALSKAIIELAEDTSLRKLLSERGRIRVEEKYRLTSTTDMQMTLYQRLLS
jgi:glycosyltransferase involved in cell wall biosynthesis